MREWRSISRAGPSSLFFAPSHSAPRLLLESRLHPRLLRMAGHVLRDDFGRYALQIRGAQKIRHRRACAHRVAVGGAAMRARVGGVDRTEIDAEARAAARVRHR